MRETCGPVLRGGAGEESGPPPPQLRPQGCDKPLGCAQPCVWGKVPPRVPAGHRPGGVEEGFDWEWERARRPLERGERLHGYVACALTQGPVFRRPCVCMLYYHHLAIPHNFLISDSVLF